MWEKQNSLPPPGPPLRERAAPPTIYLFVSSRGWEDERKEKEKKYKIINSKELWARRQFVRQMGEGSALWGGLAQPRIDVIIVCMYKYTFMTMSYRMAQCGW